MLYSQFSDVFTCIQCLVDCCSTCSKWHECVKLLNVVHKTWQTGHEALCFKAIWWWPSAGKVPPIHWSSLQMATDGRWMAVGRLNTSGFCDTPRQETWTIWTCQFLDQVGVRWRCEFYDVSVLYFNFNSSFTLQPLQPLRLWIFIFFMFLVRLWVYGIQSHRGWLLSCQRLRDLCSAMQPRTATNTTGSIRD